MHAYMMRDAAVHTIIPCNMADLPEEIAEFCGSMLASNVIHANRVRSDQGRTTWSSWFMSQDVDGVDVISVYIRKEPMTWLPNHERLIYNVMNISSVEVEPQFRRKGAFKAFMKRLCEALDAGKLPECGGLAVTNIWNAAFAAHMRQAPGWREIRETSTLTSFVREPQPS